MREGVKEIKQGNKEEINEGIEKEGQTNEKQKKEKKRINEGNKRESMIKDRKRRN